MSLVGDSEVLCQLSYHVNWELVISELITCL